VAFSFTTLDGFRVRPGVYWGVGPGWYGDIVFAVFGPIEFTRYDPSPDPGTIGLAGLGWLTIG